MQSLGKSHKHANPDKARDPVLGDILVVVAQIAAALQFIIEEKYLAKYRVPALLGVGLEGMWGLLLSAIALPVLSVVKGSDGLATDSLFSAFREISHSWQLQVGPECQLQFFAVVCQRLNPESYASQQALSTPTSSSGLTLTGVCIGKQQCLMWHGRRQLLAAL